MEDNTQYLKELAEAEKRKKQTELDQARAEATLQYENEQNIAKPKYTEQRQQANVQSQVGAKNLAEFWARRGQTNQGISAQAELSRGNALAGTIGGINRNENEYMGQLQNQYNTANRDINNQLTNAYSNIDTNLQNNLYNENVRVQQETAKQKQYQEEMAYQKQQDAIKYQQYIDQLNYQKSQDAINNSQEWSRINNTKKQQEQQEPGLREGAIDVKNGVPYQVVNGKYIPVEYPKDQFGNKIYTKQEKFNKLGYDLTNQKAPVTYTDRNGKIQNLDIWLKGNDAYIMPYDVPVIITGTTDQILSSLNNGVTSGKLPKQQATRIANELGIVKAGTGGGGGF